MPKVKSSSKAKRASGRESHNTDLGESIEPTSCFQRPSKSKKVHQTESVWKTPKTTERILTVAKQQLDELEEKEQIEKHNLEFPKLGSEPIETEDNVDEGEYITGDDVLQDYKLTADDEKSFQTFMNTNPVARKTIADLVAEKLAEKRANVAELGPDLDTDETSLPPEIEQSYEELAKFLASYRSGKVPKLFKFVPGLRDYELILDILEPDDWTAAAMYKGTICFAKGNTTDMRAQKFYHLCLLPRIRDDIKQYKKLNPHLHKALEVAMFRTKAFVQGIILPLCEEGTCTLREATIFCSVLAKKKFPVYHASCAIFCISQMRYNGANSIFLRTFIEKKYALPFQAIDALFDHFISFMTQRNIKLPVLWHLCLKSFAQNYARHCASEQREKLLELLKIHKHHLITPEVRTILQTAESRDIEMMTS